MPKETKVYRDYEICIKADPVDRRLYERKTHMKAPNIRSAVQSVCQRDNLDVSDIKWCKNHGVIES